MMSNMKKYLFLKIKLNIFAFQKCIKLGYQRQLSQKFKNLNGRWNFSTLRSDGVIRQGKPIKIIFTFFEYLKSKQNFNE